MIDSITVTTEEDSERKARHLFVINESQVGMGEPPGENPSSIYNYYNFNPLITGSGAIAIVSAFHYPTALPDFNIFSHQFGLPVEPSTEPRAATNTVFTVINARGVQPAVDPGWAMESALDVQWAHAMAPAAKIYLVQAASNSFVDLFQAVDVANTIPNLKVVAMSWGGAEWSGETAFDVHLKQPGVIYVAGAGDVGGQTLYPSVSQYVVSVGGTSLNRDPCGRLINETGWSNGGGGPSIFVPIPDNQAAQPAVAAKCGQYRGTPDVAFSADPASGFSIYDSTPYNGISGWVVIGGTSAATPCWSGVIGCLRYVYPFLNSTQEFLSLLYEVIGLPSYTEDFHDIIYGTAGLFSCEPGWDFVTGLGTPNISKLICYFFCLYACSQGLDNLDVNPVIEALLELCDCQC